MSGDRIQNLAKPQIEFRHASPHLGGLRCLRTAFAEWAIGYHSICTEDQPVNVPPRIE